MTTISITHWQNFFTTCRKNNYYGIRLLGSIVKYENRDRGWIFAVKIAIQDASVNSIGTTRD